MTKKCAICNEKIEEEYGKLKGTMLRVKNEKGKKEFVYVCSSCQKLDNWIEKANVKSAWLVFKVLDNCKNFKNNY